MNIKEIADNLSHQEFVDLIAHRLIGHAVQHFADEDARGELVDIDETPRQPTYEDYDDLASYAFYDGMHSEPDVALAIEKLLLSPTYAYLFAKDE